MQKKVHKIFWAWDHEKEEKWLNEMSEKGLQLVSVNFFTYHFKEGGCGEYIYRLEMLEHFPAHAESAAYIHFMEETGVEYIDSITRWVYFRKKKSDGKFEIYSDIDSHIKMYRRVNALVLILLFINCFPAIGNISNYLNYRASGILFSLIIEAVFILLLCFGSVRICHRISKLKKERKLRE